MFGLEPAPRYRLARPPLSQAFGQIRFPVSLKLSEPGGITPVQASLVPIFRYMNPQQVQQVSLLIGPAGPAAAGGQVSQSWRFTDDASGWSLVLSTDTATLAVGPEYGAFEEFSNRFQTVLSALGEDAQVARVNRLGVRYVNIAEVPPGDPDAWRTWFVPELTGWSATTTVGDGTRLLASITQTQLAAPATGDLSGPPADIQAIVRHGFVPANTLVPGILPAHPQNPAFLLDIDLFVEANQSFDAEELTRQLTMLHDQIDRFFYWSIAPAGAAYFGVEVMS